MKTFKTKAVVLREYQAGESDKRLVLLGKDCGKITVYARGAIKPKSKFLAASQLFTYGDYVIAEGRGFYSLNQAEVIEGFFAVREDYDALCCGQYMLEVCDRVLPQGTPCNELLYSLLKALQFLTGGKIPTIQVLWVFLFRFFYFYGIAPGTALCCACAKTLTSYDKPFFCYEGMICETCAKIFVGEVLNFSGGTVAAINHILNSPDDREAYFFKASERVLAELAEAAQLYWLGHFDALPKSHALLVDFKTFR